MTTRRSFILVRPGVCWTQFEAADAVELMFAVLDNACEMAAARFGWEGVLLKVVRAEGSPLALAALSLADVEALGELLEERKGDLWRQAVEQGSPVEALQEVPF